jgi:hypothetical protein
MLQVSGLPRLFCDLFMEERESEKRIVPFRRGFLLYYSNFSHIVQFHCATGRAVNHIKKSSTNFQFCGQKNVGTLTNFRLVAV